MRAEDLTVINFLSVDGVYQAPGGPEENRGGWLVPHFDEATGQIMDSVFDHAEIG